MCIKLVRYYECETASHIVRRLIRCSTPPHSLDEGLKMVDQYCFVVPVEIDEWYNESCPDCTGEGPVPKGPPAFVRTADVDKTRGPPTWEETWARSADRQNPSYNYAHALAEFLYFVFTQERTRDKDRFWLPDILEADADDPDVEAKDLAQLRERFRLMFRELLCRYHPMHGSLYEIVGEDHTFVPSGTCNCEAIDKPYLNNPLTNIRMNCARDLLTRLCNQPDNPGKKFVADQEEIIQEYQKLLTSFNRRGDVRDPINILPPEHIANWKLVVSALHGDLSEIYKHIKKDVGDDDEIKRMNDRAELLHKVVAELLVRDTGLTQNRRRDVMMCFVRNFYAPPGPEQPLLEDGDEEESSDEDNDADEEVDSDDDTDSDDSDDEKERKQVKKKRKEKKKEREKKREEKRKRKEEREEEDNQPKEYVPAVNDNRPFDRLRVLFTRFKSADPNNKSIGGGWMSNYIQQFYDEKFGLDVSSFYEAKWQSFHAIHQNFAKRMVKKLVVATPEDLKELPEEDSRCPACLCSLQSLYDRPNRFPGEEKVYGLPVQAKKCYKAGSRHWFCRPCIIQFGLARLGQGIYNAVCPSCRTQFAKIKPPDPLPEERPRPPPQFGPITGEDTAVV